RDRRRQNPCVSLLRKHDELRCSSRVTPSAVMPAAAGCDRPMSLPETARGGFAPRGQALAVGGGGISDRSRKGGSATLAKLLAHGRRNVEDDPVTQAKRADRWFDPGRLGTTTEFLVPTRRLWSPSPCGPRKNARAPGRKNL